MDYLVGDVQGCDQALGRLLALLDFSPSRDRLYMLGDLVNRGPDSLATLRRLQALGDAALCLLGNHDLHLLAVAHGARLPGPQDSLQAVLAAPDREPLLRWLQSRPLAHQAPGWLLVHAGVAPQWDAAQTLALAGEVQALLQGPSAIEFLQQMFGNQPARWDDNLQGVARWRFIVNALTRMRFCSDEGELDLVTKEGAQAAPAGMRPWFEVPGRRSTGTPIAFGHWSTLGAIDRADLLALDTGCVWGGALSAVRIDGGRRAWAQVPCAQAQVPGAVAVR
jgi:bis(5'-nucleosyl)-tetraphosphatase (symmetrical)